MDNELKDYDSECMPTFKSMMKFYGMSLKDVVETSPIVIYGYSTKFSGWYGDLIFAGLAVTAVLHEKGKSSVNPFIGKTVKCKEISKYTFHHAKKVSQDEILEPWIEIWFKNFEK